MGLSNFEHKDLIRRIKEWNTTRLDLFKISEPNKRNEFSGVVRFFFRGDDGKYQSKCIRITNTATARHLVNVLVEKFHPDLRMLTAGRYAIYEYHENSGERRLGADEAPLLVQLNWTAENQEGRFILRDESKPQTITRLDSTYQNGSATVTSTTTPSTNSLKKRTTSKSLLPTENTTEDKQTTRGFVRRWSSGSRKKRRKSSKNRSDAIDEQERIPDTTFTRTLSNPDEVLRRRRQQRMHNRNQATVTTDGNKRGSLVKIYGGALNPTIPYILLPLSPNDTAEQIVLWTLEKYNLLNNHIDSRDYCLVMVNLPLRNGTGGNTNGMNGAERLPQGVDKEITLHDKDCVLKFREMIRSNFGISNVIHIRHRYMVGKDGKRPPLPPPTNPHVSIQDVSGLYQSNYSSSTSSSQSKDVKQLKHSQQSITDMPYLVEIISDSDHSPHPRGFTIDLTDLFTRAYTLPIKLGTVESMVGAYPNVLVNKNEHPDIRPVHCTFCVVITTNQQTSTVTNTTTTTDNNNNHTSTTSKWKLPKSGSMIDLENFTNFSLLLTPSLDGFAKPPGPALIRVNGIRVTGPILVSNNAIIQLGKTLYLKYIQPIQIKSNSLTNTHNKMQITDNVNNKTHYTTKTAITAVPMTTLSTNRLTDKLIDSTMNEKNADSDDGVKLKKNSQFTTGTLSKIQPLKTTVANNHHNNGNKRSSRSLSNLATVTSPSSSDQLPLSIELESATEMPSDTLMDQFINLVNHILTCTQLELNNVNNNIQKSHEDLVKTRSFYLAPAYALYLTYRACIKKLNSVTSRCQPAEREHCISHLTNYMATRIYESVPNFNRNSNSDPALIKPLTYWLGNSSELLHFFKNDIDLCSNQPRSGHQNDHHHHSVSSPIQSTVYRDALHILAETVDHCFYYLRSVMYGILQPWLSCLTYPGDLDLQDDVLLDDKPVDLTELRSKRKEPISMQIILQYFTYLMQQLRKSRVNPALTFQLYSQLFHLISAHIFNTVLIDTEAKPRNVLNDGNLWLTRIGATRLNRRLDRIKRWAHKHGLELAVECRLQRCTQACQLIMANRTNLDEFYQHCISLISLNSIQLEWLLAHLSDPPPVPDDWIDIIVTGAKEVNDRAYADEIEHYISSGQASDQTLSELQLNELKELPIPLLLPADGYASDAMLSGIPDGLLDFLRPLIKTGLIRVKKHSIINGHLENRPWTNCMRLSMYETERDNRNQHSILKESTLSKSQQIHAVPNNTQQYMQQEHEKLVNKLKNSHSSLSGSISSDSTTSVDSNGSNFKEFSTQTVRYQPNKPIGNLQKSFNHSKSMNKDTRTHVSLPDLCHANFDQLAKEANVPIKSITQIFLKKLNNSLGLSIVAAKAEGQHQYGIYVKEIVQNGAADYDGRLKTGDQILAIGNTNLIGCAQSDAVAKISKQNKSDDGVQMIIAKKAAHYHKILELIRPNHDHSVKATTTSATMRHNHDKRYLQSSGIPMVKENKHHRVHDIQPHFNQSQPDLRTQTQQDYNSVNNPSRNTTGLSKVTSNQSSVPRSHQHHDHQYVQQKNNTDKPDGTYTSSHNNHLLSKNKRVDKTRQKIGSLSRSTPSLNLAKVGMDDDIDELEDDENYTDNDNLTTNHSNKRSMRSRTRNFGEINRPQSVGSRSTSHIDQQNLQSNFTSNSNSSFVSTTSSESDIIVNEQGDGIEQYNDKNLHNHHHLPTLQQQQQQNKDHRTESLIKSPEQNLKSHHKQSILPLPSPHHIQSQPNILEKLQDNSNDNGDDDDHYDDDGDAHDKHPPVFKDVSYPVSPPHHHRERPRPIVEPLSNELSSLESVTSQQTVCSLNDSQPITDTYNEKNKTDGNEHRRIRHQPPPPPPQANSSNHKATRNDILMNTKDCKSGKPAWRETDLDHFAKNNHHNDSGGGGNDGNVGNVGNHSHEDVNKEWNHSKSNDNRNIPTLKYQDSNGISSIVSKSYHLENDKNQLNMENSDNPLPQSKSIVHDRISQFTNDYRKYDSLEESIPTQKPASYISSSTYLNNSSDFNIVSKPSQRINSDVQHMPVYSRPLTTPSYVPSPPPVPTAEYPQYHPPERLEPVHWSTYNHCSSTNEPTNLPLKSSNPSDLQSISVANSSLKPLDQIINKPNSDNNYQSSISKYSNKSVVYRSSSPTNSAANRVIAIQSEISELEAQQRLDNRLDLAPTLDRLRVELQFQKRLAERESNCLTALNTNTANINYNSFIKEMKNSSLPEKSNTLESLHPHSFSVSNTNHVNQPDWIQKRNQAEQELLETQNQRISQLEQEHRAMLIRQELRAKERTHWFEHKHQQQVQSSPNSSSLPRNVESIDEVESWNYQNLSQVPLRQSSDDNISQASTGQNRYGRPKFDSKQETSKFTPYSLQPPVQSRLGPQIIEGELSRVHLSGTGSSVESIRVKKSVSFDKNLETISVYSPPNTPQESFIEHSTLHKTQQSNRTLGQTSGTKTSLNSLSTNSYKKVLSPPVGFEIDDKTSDKTHQPNRTNQNYSVPRSSSQGKISVNNMPTITVKPPPNAELLPFKEKMRLFAQQIGEDLPKERIKASSRQRELQSTNNVY